ncbi:hypothetical protein GCM10022226_46900 [Sphaerisporangium flaviroseum]|uniref:SHSP domain-containing protein n=1 Tax=Sphaerisporangium flaviroseum TaxID=509199 RepID=A0ABP7ILF7_9ACTN
MRWPRRNGSGKIWLSESDIEAAYRRRFGAAVDLEARRLELAKDAMNAVQSASGNLHTPMLTITLVSDPPGDMILDSPSAQAFAVSVHTDDFAIGMSGSIFDRTGVARRRLVAQAGVGTSHAVRADLYVDGAGTLVSRASHPNAELTFTLGEPPLVIQLEAAPRPAKRFRLA